MIYVWHYSSIYLQHDLAFHGPQKQNKLLLYTNGQFFNRKFGKNPNNTGSYFRWEESEIIKKSLSSTNTHYSLLMENHQLLCQSKKAVSTMNHVWVAAQITSFLFFNQWHLPEIMQRISKTSEKYCASLCKFCQGAMQV